MTIQTEMERDRCDLSSAFGIVAIRALLITIVSTLTLPGNTRINDRKGGVKMAQRNPVARDDVSTAEIARRQLEKLAAEQGVRAITDFDSLKADFWPEDESVDDFVRTIRERRRDSGRRSIEQCLSLKLTSFPIFSNKTRAAIFTSLISMDICL